MMEMLDQDLEQLEQYLDGALDSAAMSQLQSRLSAQSDLASVLTDLKAQRAMRSTLWQTINPDSASADRLVWRIKGAMLNQQRSVAAKSKFTWNSWRVASVSSAAAACVILGFMFGRVGHNPAAAQSPSQDFKANLPVVQNGTGPVPPFSTALTANNKPKISVPITDEYGQVVAWQTFDNPEDAKNFTEDLHKTRPQQSAPALSSPPRLVDQQQF